MKHVLSLSTLYPNAHAPRFGAFVARSLEALAARGDWRVTVINPIGVPPIPVGEYRHLQQAAIDETVNNVEVYRPVFTLIPKLGVSRNPGIIARKVLPLAKQLHANHPFDIIDTQFFYPDGPAAARIAHELNLPFSIKARGSDISYWGNRNFARRQMVDSAHRANGLLAVSAALAEEMVEIGMPASKITVHYTGLDRDRFHPLNQTGLRGRLEEQLGFDLPKETPLLVTVGALLQFKGQDLVIQALPALPDARLLLVGKGEYERPLRELAEKLGVSDRVHFTGSIDHDLLPAVLSAADAMVLPSAREGLANAWVEALACGTPIVISDVGGARELLINPVAGTIVERDVESVTQGILQVLNQAANSQEIAATAERFSWDTNAQALSEYYQRLIGNRYNIAE